MSHEGTKSMISDGSEEGSSNDESNLVTSASQACSVASCIRLDFL